MDETTLHAIQSAIGWLTGGIIAVVVTLIVILALVGWIATTVNFLKSGMKKFFDWYDERPCAQHKAELDHLKEQIRDLRQE